MFQTMSVFAEFEPAMIQERVRSGLARGKGSGEGRRSAGVTSDMEDAIRSSLKLAASASEPEVSPNPAASSGKAGRS